MKSRSSLQWKRLPGGTDGEKGGGPGGRLPGKRSARGRRKARPKPPVHLPQPRWCPQSQPVREATLAATSTRAGRAVPRVPPAAAARAAGTGAPRSRPVFWPRRLQRGRGGHPAGSLRVPTQARRAAGLAAAVKRVATAEELDGVAVTATADPTATAHTLLSGWQGGQPPAGVLTAAVAFVVRSQQRSGA